LKAEIAELYTLAKEAMRGGDAFDGESQRIVLDASA
jgi:hypothetical protein